jgi:phage-related protein
MQNVVFHRKAIDEIKALPKSVRNSFGELLRLLQEGTSLGMPISRPMPVVAMGVDELRVKGPGGQYRAFYLKKSKAGILVLRVFTKKTEATPHSEIFFARRRLQELINEYS